MFPSGEGNWQTPQTPFTMYSAGGVVRRPVACEPCRRARARCVRQNPNETPLKPCLRCSHQGLSCTTRLAGRGGTSSNFRS